MKDKVINAIINCLIPLRNLYDVDSIINDLKNNNYESLINFVNKYYKNDLYSQELIDLIKDLVSNNYLDNSYLNIVNNQYEIIDFNYSNVLFKDAKAINLTGDKFKVLRKNETNEIIDDDEIVNESKKSDDAKKTDDDTEILTLDDNIEVLRKIILDSQLAYLNNANKFIDDLESKDEEGIYHTLLNLNDIRYIQHCISNLSLETLERLKTFIEKIEENKHNLINTFMEEAIKRSIHNYKKVN